jgi:hypothetical protein
VGVLAGVGAAAASGRFDDHVKEVVQSLDCNLTTDDAHLVASAIDTRGDTIELWTLDADDGFGRLAGREAARWHLGRRHVQLRRPASLTCPRQPTLRRGTEPPVRMAVVPDDGAGPGGRV